jgi:hypothetical protein
MQGLVHEAPGFRGSHRSTGEPGEMSGKRGFE